jgi:hypothetical protein
MKALYAIVPAALLGLAGCATTENEQYAQKECKVVELKPGHISGTSPKPAPDSLAQRTAEMDLASSPYRIRSLNRNPGINNNLEDALRDCY